MFPFHKKSRDKIPSDGSTLDVVSTSLSTADVSPIILQQSDTDVTRTVFQPQLVDNCHDSTKCVSGKIIYEKRSRGDTYPTDKVTPIKVKVGEIIEIPLDTTATLALYENLSSLYNIYRKDGIPFGAASYRRMDSSFQEFLEIIQNDPSAARMIGDKTNFELVKILLRLITQAESTQSLANALENLQNDNISQLSDSLSAERLNRVINLIESNLNNSQEEFWHKSVFKENQWVLAQLFSAPCTIFQDKVYVGGKSIDNQAGNLCDFLYKNQLSGNVVLIEIKTPETGIIQSRYRNTYSFTTELSGAINQVIHYRDGLVKEYNAIVANSNVNFRTFNPKCAVIIGKIGQLTPAQVGAFENYRNSLNNIEIITFDEILQRLKDLRDIFSGNEAHNNSYQKSSEEADEELPF